MLKRLPIIIALCALAIASTYWFGRDLPTTYTPSGSGEALIGGEFSLTDQHGNPYTHNDMLGHYSLVFFGFTHCPDICPTALLNSTLALAQLGDAAKQVKIVFISVDPERDNPASMKLFVNNFSPDIAALSGTAEQVKQAANAYKVFYSKVEQKDSAIGYVVDHSAYLYLMGKDGKYISHFPHNVAQQELADTLKRIINP